MAAEARGRQYWIQTRRLTVALLLVWFVVTFVASYFARSLSFTFLGWPFSFYMAAQGSLLVYLLIVLLYARWQGARDAAFDAGPDEGN
ncbi:Membrane protein [Burkholderiales bacterium]|nr:Membrane protein [Burkholderiales bacterium]